MAMKLYTVKEVMSHLHLKKRDKVYQLCACHYFPCFKFGNSWLIDALEFDKWLDQQLKTGR